MAVILAIESSCDEMSVAILKDGKELLSHVVASQIDIHKQYGGVVPEIASRKHVECVSTVLKEALKQAEISLEEIDAIAVTKGPGLVGSLHVGMQEAKTLAIYLNKPLIGVHHIAGHIYANELVNDIEYPAMALVVSGGHTELVYMKKEFSFEVIGTTFDDAIGEAYDKVGRVLHLPYPGGPVLDKMAHEGTHSYTLPKPLDDGSYNFSFSGLKSAVLNHLNSCKMKGIEIVQADIAASFQKAVIDVLVGNVMHAIEKYQIDKFAIAGGVASNGTLRGAMEEECRKRNVAFYHPSPILCTDNAAMIGAAAYYDYRAGICSGLDLNAVPNLKLGER